MSVLAIDAGTTGVTALVVTDDGRIASRGYQEFPQHFPQPGWVEHEPEEIWQATLAACREAFPRLRRVSAYATALNVAAKSDAELRRLRELGLSLLYVGPETRDDVVSQRIAKGAGFAEHALAAKRAHAAGMKLSVIFLLGAGGTERTRDHAEGSARLVTEMDPEYLSLLTLTVVPGTPIEALQTRSHTISVPPDMLGSGEHYALEVRGDSMVDAGILDGDMALIQRNETADTGDIVVALIDEEEATLKRFRRRGASIALEPANAAYEVRILPPNRVRIQGKLIGLYRKY